MNIVKYNLVKYQLDNKMNNKKLCELLNCTKKELFEMKKESHKFNEEEIKKISKMMFITEEELTTEINERINLKEKKIYGTDYLNVNYKVLNYKIHNINLISAIVDLVFLLILAIFLVSKQIVLSTSLTKFMDILKTIFVIELLVFPFMYIVLPLLKVYFNRTYEAVLTSNIKDYYTEEACGIIGSCLRRSINKSIVPYIFTIFSEAVIALYCLLDMLYLNMIKIPNLVMVVLFVISLIISIYSLKYHFGKNGNIVKKGGNE